MLSFVSAKWFKKKSGTPQNEQRDDVNLGRDAEIVDPSQ